jgi:hypothetical protein
MNLDTERARCRTWLLDLRGGAWDVIELNSRPQEFPRGTGTDLGFRTFRPWRRVQWSP